MPAYDLFAVAVAPLISAASGLGGVFLGGWLTRRSQKLERRQRFIRDQLSEFYAPMLGYRERLKARGEMRLRVRDAAGSEWARRTERESGTDAMLELREKRWPEFERVIEYDNKQLKDVDIPTYRQMLDLFTAKMHLAEPSTRTHFAALVEFLDMWERSLTGNLPREVLSRIGADEKTLSRFYLDLQENFDRLQAALKE